MPQLLNSAMLERIADDIGAEIAMKLLTTIRDDIDVTLQVIGGLMIAKDLDGVCGHAHRIKASSQTVGMEELALCAGELEVACRDNRGATARNVALRLPEVVRATLAEVDAVLASKAGPPAKG